MKAGPFFIVSLVAKVAKKIKFSLISSENKLVTQVNIYFVKWSNLLFDACAIKHAQFM